MDYPTDQQTNQPTDQKTDIKGHSEVTLPISAGVIDMISLHAVSTSS